MPPSWSLRPATADDAQWMADLKAVAMRPDLERLGYWHRDRARQRFLDAYIPPNTRVIVIDRWAAGLIAVRPEPDALWIEHFISTRPFRAAGSVVRSSITLWQPAIPDLSTSRSFGVAGRVGCMSDMASSTSTTTRTESIKF